MKKMDKLKATDDVKAILETFLQNALERQNQTLLQIDSVDGKRSDDQHVPTGYGTEPQKLSPAHSSGDSQNGVSTISDDDNNNIDESKRKKKPFYKRVKERLERSFHIDEENRQRKDHKRKRKEQKRGGSPHSTSSESNKSKHSVRTNNTTILSGGSPPGGARGNAERKPTKKGSDVGKFLSEVVDKLKGGGAKKRKSRPMHEDEEIAPKRSASLKDSELYSVTNRRDAYGYPKPVARSPSHTTVRDHSFNYPKRAATLDNAYSYRPSRPNSIPFADEVNSGDCETRTSGSPTSPTSPLGGTGASQELQMMNIGSSGGSGESSSSHGARAAVRTPELTLEQREHIYHQVADNLTRIAGEFDDGKLTSNSPHSPTDEETPPPPVAMGTRSRSINRSTDKRDMEIADILARIGDKHAPMLEAKLRENPEIRSWIRDGTKQLVQQASYNIFRRLVQDCAGQEPLMQIFLVFYIPYTVQQVTRNAASSVLDRISSMAVQYFSENLADWFVANRLDWESLTEEDSQPSDFDVD